MTSDETIKRPSAPLTLFWISLLIGVVLAAVQTVLYFFCFEEEAFAYTYGIWYPTVLHWGMVAVTAVLLVASLVTVKKDAAVTLAEPNRSITFFALLCGFFFAVSVLIRLIYSVSGLSTEMTAQEIALIVCAIPCAAYFLMIALSRNPSRTLTAFLGFFPVVWCIINAFILYFDTATPHTSPVRRILYVTLAGVMLYLVAELRYVLDMGKPRQYLITGITVIPVLLAASVSNTVMVAAGRRTVGADSVFCFILFCMTAYLCCRMYSVCSGYAEKHPVVFADALRPAQNPEPSAQAPQQPVQDPEYPLPDPEQTVQDADITTQKEDNEP